MRKTDTQIPIPKIDGMINVLTGLGDSSKDKHMSMRYSNISYNQNYLSNFYVGCDLFKRIVNIPVEEMTREGFKVFVDDKDVTTDYAKWASAFDLDSKIEDCLKFARIYGGAGLVLGLNDSKDDPSLPFNPKKFSKLEYVQTFDRFYLIGNGQIDNDPASKNFRYPIFYSISSVKKSSKIHHSRIIKTFGEKVTNDLLSNYGYWGDSILTSVFDALVHFITAYKNGGYLLGETGRMVVQINKLYEMLSMNEGGEAALKQRLKAIEYSGSVINGFILGENEKADRAMINFSGIPEMIDRMKQRLSAATNIPHTIIFNESPSGLGATGNSENKNWNQYIKRCQECELRPILNRFVELFFIETMKKVPQYDIKFNPLEVPNPIEIADVQSKRVTNLRGLVADQIISPEQAIESLTDKDDYYSLNINPDYEFLRALEYAENNAEGDQNESE